MYAIAIVDMTLINSGSKTTNLVTPIPTANIIKHILETRPSIKISACFQPYEALVAAIKRGAGPGETMSATLANKNEDKFSKTIHSLPANLKRSQLSLESPDKLALNKKSPVYG